MPLAIQPELIELSDWTEGWIPDQEPATLMPEGLTAVRNLLPDLGSGTLELRKGFKRVSAAIKQGYTIQSLHPYNRLAGDTQGHYLIAVLSNGIDGVPGNVLVYAIRLDDNTNQLISPSDDNGFGTKTWDSSDARHYGVTIQETFYGGGVGDPMYSWNPDDGWNDDPSVPTDPELLDATTVAAGQRASDYAFKLGDRVLFRDPTGTPTVPSATLKTSGTDTTNTDTYTTASVSPGNSKLMLLAVLASKTAGNGPARKPRVSGCGLTWVEVESVAFGSIASPEARLTVFRAMKAAPSTGVVTMSFSENQGGVAWSMLEIDAMDTSGKQGSGAVPSNRVKTNRVDAATSLAVTMGDFSADSMTVGFFGIKANEAQTAGFGTELSDQGHATPDYRLQAIAHAGQETSVDQSSASSVARAGVGIEVLAGGAGGLLLFEVDDQPGKDRDGIRYKEWKTGKKYERRDDRVSRKASPAGESTYWRSYRCIKTHESGPSNRPGDGGGDWQTYWRQVSLPLPMDTDGNVAQAWNLIPTAPTTNIAMWHGERFWARYDDIEEQVGLSRVIFSAPSKFKKGSDIAELQWDPTKFGFGSTKRDGDGGGYEDFRTGDGDPVTAMRSFGFYGLFWKRHSLHVISGVSRDSWTKRQVADVGCISQTAHTEFAGLVYFMGDQGLFYTDGQVVEPVAGFEKAQEWLRMAVDWDDPDLDVHMWTYDNKVWCAIPTTEGRAADRVIVYEPLNKSFWSLDLAVAAAAVNRLGGIDQLFFAPPTLTGDYSEAVTAWTGTNHESTSTRVIDAVTETNLIVDPSFEPRRITPFVSELNSFDWQTLKETKSKATWVRTDTTYVKVDRTVEAAKRGRTGLVVFFDRDPYVFDSVPDRARPPLIPVPYEGVRLSFADASTGAHNISVFIRRKNWQKNRKVDYTIARFRIGSTDVPSGDHTYTYAGRGWYRMSATYTGSLSARNHGIVIKPRATVHLDKAMCVAGGLVPYFDGDGTDSAIQLAEMEGGEYAMVMQYDHPDVRSQPFDDDGGATYSNRLIAWSLRTAWLPFGVRREERRIRRVWALVKGAANVVLQAFRNYDDATAAFTTEALPTAENSPATYFEGKVMPDSYSIMLSVEGFGGPATVLGAAMDTQLRRAGRYHN